MQFPTAHPITMQEELKFIMLFIQKPSGNNTLASIENGFEFYIVYKSRNWKSERITETYNIDLVFFFPLCIVDSRSCNCFLGFFYELVFG